MPWFRKPAPEKAGEDYCRWLTGKARSNFVTAIRLLSGPKRRAMEAIYAYCRAVDDAVDLVPGTLVQAARRQLELWRTELSRCVEGYPSHPIALALKPVLRQYRIPVEHPEALLKGVEMDLEPRRYATFEELKVYCEHVASVVGLMSIRVFGCRHPASERYARALGVALQLTNILRDLKSDAQRGRVYLPQEEIRRFGYSEKELMEGKVNEPLRRLMAFQCERARSFFQEAREALKESGEARRLWPARAMGGVYARLLSRIEALGYEVFSCRVTVPRHEQLWIAARCLVGQPFVLILSKVEGSKHERVHPSTGSG